MNKPNLITMILEKINAFFRGKFSKVEPPKEELKKPKVLTPMKKKSNTSNVRKNSNSRKKSNL